MNGIRIWLEMSAFFTDVRKQSCMLLDYEKHKTVGDVRNHISRLYGIDQTFHLLNEGWFIPPSEPSLLLQENDLISIVPDDSSKLTNDKSALTSEESKPNLNEKDGNPKTALNIISSGEVRQVFIAHEEVNTNDQSSSSTLVQNGTLEVEEQKAKRIRRRKRKAKIGEGPDPKETNVRPSPYLQNKFLQGVGHILNSNIAESSRKHIFFKEEPADYNSSHETNGAKLSKSIVSEENCPPPVDLAPATSNVKGLLSKLMSFGNEKSPPAVFERKKIQNFKRTDMIVNEKTEPLYERRLVPLKELPVEETTITFKILKMTNYSPTISDIITARVISSDITSHQIYVEITEGLDEFQSEKGKFSLDDDDNGDDVKPSLSSRMVLNWNEVLEPHTSILVRVDG